MSETFVVPMAAFPTGEPACISRDALTGQSPMGGTTKHQETSEVAEVFVTGDLPGCLVINVRWEER